MKIEPCSVCGQRFRNIFEATDHLTEESGEEVFDPALILPNGYKLLVGSLLRLLYDQARSPKQVRDIVQNTYGTLFAAESNPSAMRAFVEEAIVSQHMYNMDEELQQLLEENDEPN